MLGIIGAMDIEVNEIKSKLTECTIQTIGNVEYHKGKLLELQVVIAKCGPGKVNAAMCAQTMILEYHVDSIINTGVGGGISEGINCTDVVIANQVVQHDIDTTCVGDPIGLISGINTVYIQCSNDIVCKLVKIASDMNEFKTFVGTIATGDQFLNSVENANRIHMTFGAIATDMEGGAIGQVCYINRIPFCVIRSISDKGDCESGIDYAKFIEISANNSIKLLEAYILEARKNGCN